MEQTRTGARCKLQSTCMSVHTLDQDRTVKLNVGNSVSNMDAGAKKLQVLKHGCFINTMVEHHIYNDSTNISGLGYSFLRPEDISFHLV